LRNLRDRWLTHGRNNLHGFESYRIGSEPTPLDAEDDLVTLPDWFGEAGFGLFVHWDHASQQGVEIGWPLVGKSIFFAGLVIATFPIVILFLIFQRYVTSGITLGALK
jgi:hypothetical protein